MAATITAIFHPNSEHHSRGKILLSAPPLLLREFRPVLLASGISIFRAIQTRLPVTSPVSV